MATEAHFISEDGSRGVYVHLENRTKAQVRQSLRDDWGQAVIELADVRAVQRVIRAPGPPDDQLLEG